ncbi:hypothetical protein JCM8115_001815 [Rhodotorula mucilaginosa]|uniref:tRNA-intron lyase n=1 Tax=Rhodotorula mucilaginosa TaxID=5537 RepID=A0A9P6VX32_RHOMI|nr:tRNA splicing endonuclease subunit sen2 [Rhodotorula mucilaginosa]TKA55547.1 hypothetical protein B0A53_02725 [Rhodotorula sp. CCFEE 5036]
MASTSEATKPRINATRPENLNSSAKRTSRAALLEQYAQLLPLKPATRQSYTQTLLSRFGLAGHAPLAAREVVAEWDDITQSVWVKDENDMMRLWRQGFFGKGFLSRSEPSWKRRVENRRAELEGREKKLTAEEITALRRVERKGAKLAKKLERDAEKLVAASAAATAASSSAASAPSGSAPATPTATTTVSLEGGKSINEREEDGTGGERTGPATAADPKGKAKADEYADRGASVEADEATEETQEAPPEEWQLDAEHSQLQPEEAFFLSFALGMLALVRPSPSPFSSSDASPSDPSPSSDAARRLSILETFRLFLESAAAATPAAVPRSPPTALLDPRLNRLDSPFLLSYAAYHHFRSMGWVARSGTKFCVDWVLYGQGGPVGGHAEFAVLIIPTYVDPRDAQSNPFRSTSTLAIDSDPELRGDDDGEHLQGEGERKNSWRWFHTVNRVCSGVKKTLVLLYVVIPPLSSLPPEPDWVARHPAQALAKLEMREVVVRRFLAGRMRD